MNNIKIEGNERESKDGDVLYLVLQLFTDAGIL